MLSRETPLPRSVWLLGWVSFFTDTASEAIYPLLPVFLTRVLGASAWSLGVIEGVAEAANSLLKIASGKLSDKWGVRRSLVIAGYSLSSAVRPLIALAGAWPQVLALRFFDRLGKGIRGAPRDAMLADLATTQTRGRVFGFHRAMDHTGAVAGPLLAGLFLTIYPQQYRTLFALTIVPGAIAVMVLFRVSGGEPGMRSWAAELRRPPAGERGPGIAELPRSFFVYLAVILLFTLGNSTDAFLLLRLGDLGVQSAWIPILWALLHVVKAGTSTWGGRLSDRWGRVPVISAGWIVYAFVYGGFATVTTESAAVAVFLTYGLFYGLTEGTEKALIVDLAPVGTHASAFGIYHATTGVGALAASLLFGFIWQAVGPAAAFSFGAITASVATVALLLVVRR